MIRPPSIGNREAAKKMQLALTRNDCNLPKYDTIVRCANGTTEVGETADAMLEIKETFDKAKQRRCASLLLSRLYPVSMTTTITVADSTNVSPHLPCDHTR